MKLVEAWPRPKALKLRDIRDRIRLCACGSDAHWECVLEILEMADTHSGPNNKYIEGDQGFYRDKWTEFAAKVLDGWGLLEHGTGIGWAWLTDDGSLLLDFLRCFGTEEHDTESGYVHPFWSIEFSWNGAEDPGDSYSEWVMTQKAKEVTV